FAQQINGCAPGKCSAAQIAAARDRLIAEAAQRLDAVTAGKSRTYDAEAEAFINGHPKTFAWGEGFAVTRDQYNDFKYFGELLAQDKQSLSALSQALGSA